jgi:hypothetical protein
MSTTGIWEGTLDGTNWGRLLVKIDERAGILSGHAEITDIGVGTYSLAVTGRRNADGVNLQLVPSKYAVRSYPGTIDAIILYETQAQIRGKWHSSLGTYGTFRAERQTELERPLEQIVKRKVEDDAAFIIMSFENQTTSGLPVVDIQAAIKRGCDGAGVKAHRIDEIEHSGSITNLILDNIKRHRFLISDLTHERPNVYYEIGYAHGMQKEVVLTAYRDTKIHFYILNFNVIFYASGTELETRITRRLKARIDNIETVI